MKPIKIPELELKILGVFWDAGKPMSVQDIIDVWDDDAIGYTTILKKLQVMEAKGLVAHEKSKKSYRYYPLESRDDVTGWKFSDLLDQLFSGNRVRMIHAFLSQSDFSAEELEEIKKIIDGMENRS